VLALYLGAVTIALWSVTRLVPAAAPQIAATARPSASPDLAARVFTPTGTDQRAAVPTDPPPTLPPITPETLDRGERLYHWSGCVLCHGPRAEGLVGPNIARTPLEFAAVRRQVRFPVRPHMPPFTTDQLTDEGIAAIYLFLQSLPAD
jgi:mono/diheme cytochrome c family protein